MFPEFVLPFLIPPSSGYQQILTMARDNRRWLEKNHHTGAGFFMANDIGSYSLRYHRVVVQYVTPSGLVCTEKS